MTAYATTFIDPQGRRHTDTFDALDLEQLRQILKAKSLWLVRARELNPSRKLARLKIPVSDLVPLLHQLELQLRAGVTADIALAHLAEDAPKGNLSLMLTHIHREVAQGQPIHEACRYFQKQFPPHLAAVIAAGEASAQLPDSLRALADHLSSIDALQRTARRALIYPAIVLTAVTGLILFLLGGVVPKFAEIFESLHLDLPAITIFLIQASDFIRAEWLGLLVGGATVVLLLGLISSSRRGRQLRDALTLRLPVWGETIRCLTTARFAAHCRLLHEAGVPLLDALDTAADLVNHASLAAQLRSAREEVARGRPLYAALPAKHDFPAFIIPALKAGETTGQLGTALQHIEVYASRRAAERLATALALLEPMLLAGLTAVVGAIALSFFLPLFSLLGGINTH